MQKWKIIAISTICGIAPLAAGVTTAIAIANPKPASQDLNLVVSEEFYNYYTLTSTRCVKGEDIEIVFTQIPGASLPEGIDIDADETTIVVNETYYFYGDKFNSTQSGDEWIFTGDKSIWDENPEATIKDFVVYISFKSGSAPAIEGVNVYDGSVIIPNVSLELPAEPISLQATNMTFNATYDGEKDTENVVFWAIDGEGKIYGEYESAGMPKSESQELILQFSESLSSMQGSDLFINANYIDIPINFDGFYSWAHVDFTTVRYNTGDDTSTWTFAVENRSEELQSFNLTVADEYGNMVASMQEEVAIGAGATTYVTLNLEDKLRNYTMLNFYAN